MAVKDCRWLQPGDDGPDVLAYQQAANVWLIHQSRVGAPECDGLTRPELLDEDGQFGPLTEEVTRWLQCRFGLDMDGLAGRQTLSALRKWLAQEGLGTLSFGGAGECVTPLRYRATVKANDYRQSADLPALPVLEVVRPPLLQVPTWAWAVLAGFVAWRLLRSR